MVLELVRKQTWKKGGGEMSLAVRYLSFIPINLALKEGLKDSFTIYANKMWLRSSRVVVEIQTRD